MWILYAFICAFFRSLQDLFSKLISKDVDADLLAWAWALFSLPLLFVLSWKQWGAFNWNMTFIKALATSGCILFAATIIYFRAIQAADLSLSMPMLTLTPFFLLFTSPLILGEFPNTAGLSGILCIVIGAYLLNVHAVQYGLLAPFRRLVQEKGPRYMLVVALLYSVGANVDKIGVRHSAPAIWIFFLNSIVALAHTIRLWSQRHHLSQQFQKTWPMLVLIGMCNAIALWAQMTAITQTLVPYLIAIKRTSVMITSIFGFVLLREKAATQRLCGIGLMLVGVFVICFLQ